MAELTDDDFTPEWLGALKRAYAAGTTLVRKGEREVRYATGEDLLRRIQEIENRLRPSTERKRVGFAAFSRGYH